MRTKVAAVFVLLALVVAGLAQSGPDAGWTKYSSPDGRFSLLFPSQPKEDTTTEKQVLLHTLLVLDRPRVYMMVYSDYPEADTKVETTVRLNAERDGFLKGLSGSKLISERQFNFKRNSVDLPALEFTSETVDANYKCIVILDGARVYLLGAGSVKGNDSTAQMERFLGSLKLT